MRTRTRVVISLGMVLVGVAWGALTSLWVLDWVRQPHHTATVVSCRTVFETAGPPRACFSTSESEPGTGPLYVLGGGQGDVGDRVTYVHTHHRGPTAQRPVAFAPDRSDLALLASSLVLVVGGAAGLGAIALTRAHLGSGRRAGHGAPPRQDQGQGQDRGQGRRRVFGARALRWRDG